MAANADRLSVVVSFYHYYIIIFFSRVCVLPCVVSPHIAWLHSRVNSLPLPAFFFLVVLLPFSLPNQEACELVCRCSCCVSCAGPSLTEQGDDNDNSNNQSRLYALQYGGGAEAYLCDMARCDMMWGIASCFFTTGHPHPLALLPEVRGRVFV